MLSDSPMYHIQQHTNKKKLLSMLPIIKQLAISKRNSDTRIKINVIS